jgi:hypothetical protein
MWAGSVLQESGQQAIADEIERAYWILGYGTNTAPEHLAPKDGSVTREEADALLEERIQHTAAQLKMK